MNTHLWIVYNSQKQLEDVIRHYGDNVIRMNRSYRESTFETTYDNQPCRVKVLDSRSFCDPIMLRGYRFTKIVVEPEIPNQELMYLVHRLGECDNLPEDIKPVKDARMVIELTKSYSPRYHYMTTYLREDNKVLYCPEDYDIIRSFIKPVTR